MLIVLKGKRGRCFDASPFSAYPEEQERVFCGSTRKQTVTSIILVNSAKNYRAAIRAYSKFDAIFSGRRPEEMTDAEMEMIADSIRWIKGDEAATSHKKLDIFILETFYSFIIHKKMVYLNLNRLIEVHYNEILKMVVYPLRNQRADLRAKINDNLIKSLVFTLFPDVHQIRIDAHEYPFDLISFLNVIRSVDIPQTLEFILIEGTGCLRRAFTMKVNEQYAAEGIDGWLQENWSQALEMSMVESWSLKLNILEPFIAGLPLKFTRWTAKTRRPF